LHYPKNIKKDMTVENPSGLIKMQVFNLLKFADDFAGIELHLPVDNRFVKLNYSSDQFIDILRKLQQKEVTNVYILPADCERLMEKVENSMSAKSFYDPSTIPEKKVENTEAALKIVKQVIAHLGPEEKSVKLLSTVNSRAISLLSESPTLHAFFKRFKKNCSEEFMRTMLTTYLMSLVIDKFPWKSDALKEKGALASLLCDMLLEKEDFKLIRDYEKTGLGDLPERIKQHPVEVAEQLRKKRNLIPGETLTIIELHHETPDGKGFPRGITASRFNHLACIFILCQRFIEELYEEEFNFEKRHEIIARLQEKFGAKSFEKSFSALVSVVDV
jgi:hypothetical protein